MIKREIMFIWLFPPRANNQELYCFSIPQIISKNQKSQPRSVLALCPQAFAASRVQLLLTFLREAGNCVKMFSKKLAVFGN